jgi:hypothetical protein
MAGGTVNINNKYIAEHSNVNATAMLSKRYRKRHFVSKNVIIGYKRYASSHARKKGHNTLLNALSR